MKTSKLKIVIVIALSVFVAVCFSACGDNQSSQTISEEEIADELETAIDSIDGIASSIVDSRTNTIFITVEEKNSLHLPIITEDGSISIQIYSDTEKENQLYGTLQLQEGDNTFIAEVNKGKAIANYTMIIHRHQLGEWQTTVNPTCTTDGRMIRECFCGYRQTEKINNLGGHALIHHEAKIPTCTESGWRAYDTCSKCDFTTYEELKTLDHIESDVIIENRFEATCTTDGYYDSVIYCTVCKAELSREKIIVKKSHMYSTEWTIDIEPTCGTCGSKSHHCSRCSEKTDITAIPKTEKHTIIIDEMVAPTYSTRGRTEGKHCSVCDEILVEQKDIATLWNGDVKEPKELIKKDGLYYYLINSAEELAFLTTVDDTWDNRNYLLNCNIFLNAKVLDEEIEFDENGDMVLSEDNILSWGLIKRVNIFDGNNYFISGVYCKNGWPRTGPGGYAGVFARATKIKNLIVKDSYMKGYYYAGGIAAIVNEIDNCTFEGVIVGNAQEANGYPSGGTGGICGSGSIIKDCQNKGIVRGTAGVGGIVGYSSGELISNCENYGAICGTIFVGGILGFSEFSSNTINSCKNYGLVDGVNMVGGIMGAGGINCNNCENLSDITGTNKVGGILGRFYGNCNGCINHGTIHADTYVGGIIGYAYGTTNRVKSFGNVNGEDSVGAIIGFGDVFSGNYSISNSVYLKNDKINTEITGIGNLPDEADIVVINE